MILLIKRIGEKFKIDVGGERVFYAVTNHLNFILQQF